MNKKALILALSLAMLTGCGGETEKSPTEDTKQEVKQEETVKEEKPAEPKKEEKKEEPKQEVKKEEPKQEAKKEDSVPREYKNALKSAENYISFAPFSRQGLYDQLTSEYGDKYPEEAAQYAIDNIQVDYKEQALKAANNYLDMMPMSDEELKDQLMSEYGDKYTEEEAQYAIDNLE